MSSPESKTATPTGARLGTRTTSLWRLWAIFSGRAAALALAAALLIVPLAVHAQSVPAAPGQLAATAGDSTVTLGWTDPENDDITKYQISTDGGSNFINILCSDDTPTGHTVAGLTNGTSYTFVVRAYDESGPGASATVTATPLLPAPTELVAWPGDNYVQLRWKESQDSRITGYEVSKDGGLNYSKVRDQGHESETFGYSIYQLTNGTNYTIKVRAVNGAAATFDTTKTTPVIPALSSLRATPGYGRVTLSWRDPKDSDISKYQFSSDGGNSYTSVDSNDLTYYLDAVNREFIKYTIDGLTNDTSYTFKVRTADAEGTVIGAVSPTEAEGSLTATPLFAAPSNLTAAPGASQVTLSWDDPETDEISKYQLKIDSDPFTDIAYSDATTTSHTVTGLTNYTSYTFEVRASDSNAAGPSATVTAYPVAGPTTPPDNLQATPADSQVTLSWDDPGDSNINGYEVSSDDGANYSAISGSSASTISHTVTSLTNWTGYTFAVRAVNTSGAGAPSKAWAEPGAVPVAVVNLTATPKHERVELSWGDPDPDDVDRRTSIYKVRYKKTNDNAWGEWVDIRASSTATIDELENATSYDFAVRAHNYIGDGAISELTASPVPEVPTAPTNLVATRGDGEVTLTWTDTRDDEVITNYHISSDNGTNYTYISTVVSDRETTTVSYIVRGLTNGTLFTFKVKAQNSAGTGPPQDPGVTETPLFAAPKGLQASPGGSQVTLTWDNPWDSSITGYEVSSDGGTNYSTIDNSGATTTEHTVTGQAGGTEKTFAVRAVNGVQATVRATPLFASPADLSATVGDGQVTLTWTNPGNSAISGYEVSSDNGANYTPISGSGAATNSHIVPNLSNGTEYSFAVRAVNCPANGVAAMVRATPRAALVVTFGAEIYTAVENGVAAMVKVNLNQEADREVTVHLLTVPPSGEFSLSATSLVFAKGDSKKTLTVTAHEDPNLDDETVRLEFGTLPADVTAGSQATTTVTLVDNDQATSVTFGASSYTAAENGAGAEVTVSLNKTAEHEVMVPLVTYPASGDFTAPAEVVFPVDVQVATIMVMAKEDADRDDETVRLEFGTLPEVVRAGRLTTTMVTLVDDDKDEIRPTVEIQTEATAPVGGAFEVTITFSEAVTGFEQSEITVTYGSVTGFSGSGTSYTAEISPSESGEVTVKVGANVAEDGAGNGNQSAAPLVIEADLTGPSVEITSEATGPVGTAFEVTISFSEAVTGFEREDIQVNNGTVTSFSGSETSYTAEITPSESGEVTVEVGEDVAEDGAGNGNGEAEPFTIEADLTPPEVEITREATVPVVDAFEVTITFSEPVEGFESEEIEVTNGTVVVADFTEVSSSEYRATIKPKQLGQLVVVEVAEEVAEDTAGNGNRAAEPFEVETKLVVSYEEESYTATEGAEAATVTVKLTQGWVEELAIPIQVRRPETTELDDYTVEGLAEWDAQEGTGTLTFAAEELEQTFTITADHDGDGEDETVELGFGELPEILMAGDPSVATVMLEDKGLVELQVSFGQAAYEVKEGQGVDIELMVSPAADRRVEVPLVVALVGGARPEDYSGVPALVVFEEGESEGTISVELLADEVNDPGEGIMLSLGELPEAVIAGDPSSTEVHFIQYRTAEQFSQSLEVMLAVMARSMGESAQTAIEGRFERYRQWSRMRKTGSTVAASSAATGAMTRGRAAASSYRGAGVGRGESLGIGLEGLDGFVGGSPEEPGVGGTAESRAQPETGSSGNYEGPQRESWRSWLPGLSLSSLGRVPGFRQTHMRASSGYGMAPRGRVHGQERFYGTEVAEASPRAGSSESSGTRAQGLNLSGVSVEMPLAEQEAGKGWAPVLWAQGDLQSFDGELKRIGMNYRGGLKAAHVGVDFYINVKMLAGLSYMRSWGDLDYTDDGVDGVLESRINSVHPYLYWQPKEGFSTWVIGGWGAGQVEVREPGRDHDFDADFRMLAGGTRAVLRRRGNSEWGLRADAFTAQLGTAALEDLGRVSGEAHRARFMVEWVHDRALSEGRSLSLKAEVGERFDGGDAELGSGLESGFRLGYMDGKYGVDVALQGRVLLVHTSDYRDWGLGLQASWDPGEKGRGIRASVSSSRGRDGGGRTTLWDNPDAVTRPLGMGPLGMSWQSRMEGEVAYAGLEVPGIRGQLTPYSRVRWTGEGRELAWGTAWSLSAGEQLAQSATFELEGMSRESRTGEPDHGLLLRMSIPF